MTSAIQDPGALNALLTEIVTALLDQADGEIQGRTGHAVPSVQKLKLHAARRVAALAMKQLGRVQDPQERLRRLAELTNRYLPATVEVVGQEAVQARLERLPGRLRSPEVVRLCQDAGATELARLLGGGPPASEPASEPAPPGVAPSRPPSPATPTAPVLPPRAPASPAGGAGRADLLRSQIDLMETMQRQIEEALPRLRRALEEELAR